jgi:hypothetical protein
MVAFLSQRSARASCGVSIGKEARCQLPRVALFCTILVQPVTHLESTPAQAPLTIDSKQLAEKLNPLEATLMKN